MGEPVAESERFDVTTEHDNTDEARDRADEMFNANPRVKHARAWRIDGDHIRYANIERVD